MKPVCSKCVYLTTDKAKFRKCPSIPIFHRDMLCSNENNSFKDSVTGEPINPFCEEVNRYGECLFFYPKGLETPEIFYDGATEVTIKGTSPIVYTTDGTAPTTKTNLCEKMIDDVQVARVKIEHTCTVIAECVMNDAVGIV